MSKPPDDRAPGSHLQDILDRDRVTRMSGALPPVE
jgi:hypothetical protein